MGTGQMLLTVMAVFILSTVILTSNRSYTGNTGTIISTKLNMIATSLATSRIQKASRLAFDNNTRALNDTLLDQSPVTTTGGLSQSPLGPEGGESNGTDQLFNDVDDYNGFTVVEGTPSGDSFTVSSNVSYVSQNTPFDATVTGPTWFKRMDVVVTPKVNPTPGETVYPIRMQQVFSFWRWR